MKKESKTHKIFGAYSPQRARRCHLEWAASLLSKEHWSPLHFSLDSPLSRGFRELVKGKGGPGLED